MRGGFDLKTFMEREKYRPNYEKLAYSLQNILPFDSVLDVGCGNGFLLEALGIRGRKVIGVDIAPEAKQLVSDKFQGSVLTLDAILLDLKRRFDLVTCIEVAEHIESRHSEALIASIVRHASRWVYFTAAMPYQPGVGHINCRPQFYWMREFRRHGFFVHWELTSSLIKAIEGLTPAKWIPLNSLIFEFDPIRMPP